MSKKRTKRDGKRRDSQGRVLHTGEYQRSDGLYEYRYTYQRKRHSVYDRNLHSLRRKEEEIRDMRRSGLDYNSGGITVLQLSERYIALKRGVRYSTSAGYQSVLNFLKKRPDFSNCKIRDIRMSDAKLWLISLYDEGYAYSTITSIKSLLKCAFHMAYSEDILRRNPFDFRMDIIPNNTKKRVALTLRQQEQFMDFIASHKHYRYYWDEINILLGTGLRISEFCGLTVSDLDFEQRRIRVERQLIRVKGGKYRVEKTKTEAGRRFIPMSDSVYQSLLNLLKARRKVRKEVMIDGHVGFLLLDRNGNPRVASHIEHVVRRIRVAYNEANTIPLPIVTPHVFRHTFCTNMANAGMDLKSLQYLMGHTDATVTLNVYSHNSYELAEIAMGKITPLGRGAQQGVI